MLLLRGTVLLLLVCGLWDFATGSEGAIDCCLATSKSRIPSRIVKTYTVQTKDGGCKVDATLFITKVGRKLCAPPASEQKWVRHLIKKIAKESGRSDKDCRRGKNQRRRSKNCKN